MTTEHCFLVLNSGSSSLKFSIFRCQDLRQLVHGTAAELNSDRARLTLSTSPSNFIPLPNADHRQAIQEVLKQLPALDIDIDQVAAIGHRVVHGGEKFKQSVVMDEAALAELQSCNPLAPLHNPANLMGIVLLRQLCPHIPQVAVFDTAFHQTLPAKAYLYPVPYYLYKEHGVRRYGFHGTSHRYVSQRAISQLTLSATDHQLLIAHLGNGCSASAIINGQSVDTTMGLTPLEGAMMGTRSGDVDPGLHQYLQRQLGWDLDRITAMLNNESGLLGLSGISNDMREIYKLADRGQHQARLAISVFCFRLARLLGGLATSLQRIDALIFTGGIGEHQGDIRARIIKQLSILGFTVDEQRNGNHGATTNGVITKTNSTTAAVIATDEEHMIAMDCAKIFPEFCYA